MPVEESSSRVIENWLGAITGWLSFTSINTMFTVTRALVCSVVSIASTGKEKEDTVSLLRGPFTVMLPVILLIAKGNSAKV